LKVLPWPKRRGTIQVFSATLEAGCATVRQMLSAWVVPASAEIMDRLCLEAVMRQGRMTFPDEAQACLVIEIDGEDEGSLQAQTGRIASLAQACGCLSFQVAQSQAESDALWAVRREVSSAVAALAPNRLSEDISVPRAAFPEVVARIQEISASTGFPIAVFGHAGDGNIHPSVLCDRPSRGAERVHEAIDRIFAAALAVGGTLSGEHGNRADEAALHHPGPGRGRGGDHAGGGSAPWTPRGS
jgi:glycolate oxidase